MINVNEIDRHRFQVILELLEEGESFSFDGVSFWVDPSGPLRISVFSAWYFENITREIAIAELNRAKSVFEFLFSKSAEFRQIVKGRPQEYYLVSGDEKSGVDIARMNENHFSWCGESPREVMDKLSREN